ncbi:MAG: peptide chain release factor N(5)-glutamine methyltransferase, partial [Myxococcales bacterium]|nr:peptide chain release factor N(5)-glutamine methyltransferase [Myxococcales bacterium]
LRAGDLFDAVDPGVLFDVISANPPYIPSGEMDGLQADVRLFEPRAALDGGSDGLDLLRRIVAGAAGHLSPGGVLALEVGAGEAHAVRALLEAAGYTEIDVRRDYGRIERVVSGRAPTAS